MQSDTVCSIIKKDLGKRFRKNYKGNAVMKKATLKQIADIAGVSVTTVHRALNGKGGCSEEVEAEIQVLGKMDIGLHYAYSK